MDDSLGDRVSAKEMQRGILIVRHGLHSSFETRKSEVETVRSKRLEIICPGVQTPIWARVPLNNSCVQLEATQWPKRSLYREWDEEWILE